MCRILAIEVVLILGFFGALDARSQQLPHGTGHPNPANHWYDGECCSNRDCEAIPDDAVREVEGGFLVEYLSTSWGHVRGTVPYSRVRPSKACDEQGHCFHACAKPPTKQGDPGGVRCLYVPSMS